MDREPVQVLGIKTALWLGFGLTFGIWVVAGAYFTNRISETEGRAAAVNSRYTQAQELLSNVRAQVLLGSVYVRDALLDPNPSIESYRRQVEETHAVVNRSLDEYVPVLDSSIERERVGRLQREIDEFRVTMLQVLSTDSTRWPADARDLLRTQIVPKRQTVIRVSEEVQALNRSAFVQQQRDIAAIYSASQRQLWVSLGLALGGSLGIALAAALYAGRLERRLQQQRLRDIQNTRDLQHLSAKLITAQEEERRSIARELHDEVGQVLTAIKVELAVAQRTIEAGGGNGTLLADARSITDGALATVRDLSHLLHPSLLDDLGLPAAIEWYLRGFGRRHGIRAEVLHDLGDDRFAPEIEASAYRIVQEALTNVAKHARALTCRVYLQRLPNTVLVTVEDDGVGFSPAELDRADPRPGLGLVGIRERAIELGGTFRMESTAGKGTRLTVELPVRMRGDARETESPDHLRPIIDPTPRAVLNG